MEPLSLNLSLTQNRALNHDGITALRALSLTQQQTYSVALSLYSGTTLVSPEISNFNFLIRSNGGADIISVHSGVASGSGFAFTLPVTSPYLTPTATFKGYFSFNADGNATIIDPFTVGIARTTGNGTSSSFVSSLNGLSSDVTISGSGSIAVSQSGQVITLFGAAATGDYYPNDNPSGFITSADLVPYATASNLDATGNSLQLQFASLAAQTGNYYQNSNPSGYITASALSPYATAANLAITGGGLQSQIDSLVSHTGDYYPRSNPSGYATTTYVDTVSGNLAAAIAGNVPTGVVHTTGNETISGVKTFAQTGVFNGGVKTQFLYDNNGAQSVDLSNHILKNAGTTPWKIDSDYVAIEPFSAYGTLTKIVPGSPATDAAGAVLTFYDSSFDNVYDGQSFTVTYNGSLYTFEWDNNSTQDVGGSILISIGGSRSDTISNFIGVINSTFYSAFTVVDDSYSMTFTTPAGSSYSAAFAGSIGYDSYDQSSTGTDATSATPDTGTRLVTLKNAVSNRLMKALMISISVRDVDWANTGIEIGYYNGESFTALCQIPQGYLTVGLHHLFQHISFPNEYAMGLFYSGYSYNLIARSGQDGTPADESTGGDVYIYVKGVYSTT